MRHACAPEGRPAPRSRCGTHPLVAAEWWVYLVEIGICKGGQSRRCVQHLLGKRCHARGQHSRTAERRCVHRGRRWKGVGAPSSPQALLSERSNQTKGRRVREERQTRFKGCLTHLGEGRKEAKSAMTWRARHVTDVIDRRASSESRKPRASGVSCTRFHERASNQGVRVGSCAAALCSCGNAVARAAAGARAPAPTLASSRVLAAPAQQISRRHQRPTRLRSSRCHAVNGGSAGVCAGLGVRGRRSDGAALALHPQRPRSMGRPLRWLSPGLAREPLSAASARVVAARCGR